MTDVRTTQVTTEVLHDSGAVVRDTQLENEVLHDSLGIPRNTQLTNEVMQNALGILRNTQLALEVLFDVDYFSVMSYDSIGEVIFGSVVIR
jgi:ADP-glucose pyrophosphorylase